jgi:hypothetical protein
VTHHDDRTRHALERAQRGGDALLEPGVGIVVGQVRGYSAVTTPAQRPNEQLPT